MGPHPPQQEGRPLQTTPSGRPEETGRTAADSPTETAAGGPPAGSQTRQSVYAAVSLPGILSVLLMVAAWLLPRTHLTVLLVVGVLVVLFAVQFRGALKHESGPKRVASVAFAVVLLYFALFGLTYAEYADLSRASAIFATDRLGEAFMLSTSMGTATGFFPGRPGGADPGFLAIVHLQILVLAVGVATSTAASLARAAAARGRREAGDRS